MAKTESTQKFVTVKEVKDNIAIMDDNSFRGILMVSTINFALKSEDERKGILMQFQDLLNTLDFSLQIYVQSRELNIEPYIELLEGQYKSQENELLKVQTREYINFIKDFTENVNIMTKSFFAVVPYYPSVISSKKGGIFSVFGGKKSSEEKEKSFGEYKTQLEQRMLIVDQGLSRVGLRTERLDNEGIKELFHNIFNPGEVYFKKK